MDFPFEITYSCYRAQFTHPGHPGRDRWDGLGRRDHWDHWDRLGHRDIVAIAEIIEIVKIVEVAEIFQVYIFDIVTSLTSEMVYFWSLRRGWTPKNSTPSSVYYSLFDALTKFQDNWSSKTQCIWIIVFSYFLYTDIPRRKL